MTVSRHARRPERYGEAQAAGETFHEHVEYIGKLERELAAMAAQREEGVRTVGEKDRRLGELGGQILDLVRRVGDLGRTVDELGRSVDQEKRHVRTLEEMGPRELLRRFSRAVVRHFRG